MNPTTKSKCFFTNLHPNTRNLQSKTSSTDFSRKIEQNLVHALDHQKGKKSSKKRRRYGQVPGCIGGDRGGEGSHGADLRGEGLERRDPGRRRSGGRASAQAG